MLQAQIGLVAKAFFKHLLTTKILIKDRNFYVLLLNFHFYLKFKEFYSNKKYKLSFKAKITAKEKSQDRKSVK